MFSATMPPAVERMARRYLRAPAIISVTQKKAGDVLVKALNSDGYNAVSIHGGKQQEVREESLTAFKEGQVDILVATDVAGRGIDVKGVKHVINFDMPKSVEDYAHRIGRTGRAGMKGTATSFITESDSHLFYDLNEFMKSTNQLVPLEIQKHQMTSIKPGSEKDMARKFRAESSVVYAS